MQNKIVMTGVACALALWGVQAHASSTPNKESVRISAIFGDFPQSLDDKVSFVMPDGSEVVRAVKKNERISINDAYMDLPKDGKFNYIISSHYAGQGTGLRYFKDEGVCQDDTGLPREKDGKILEAVQLRFTYLVGKNPKTEDGPWFSCSIWTRYSEKQNP